MQRLFTALLFSVAATAAMAQTTAPATDTGNAAVATSSSNNTGMPAAGANSFTEDQAKSHIEAKGYNNVSALTKDQDGIWRGKGMKDNMSHDVALDYQGNVFGK